MMKRHLKIFIICFFVVFLLVECRERGEEQLAFQEIGNQECLPIIDMHMHAPNEMRLTPEGLPQPWQEICMPRPRPAHPPMAKTGEDVLRLTLEVMEKHNIVKAVVSDSLENVYEWKAASPERFLAGPLIFDPRDFDISVLREEYSSGRLDIMGEIATIYRGIPPNDPSLEPFFSLAEEFDVPVLIHCQGTGGADSRFRISAGHPLLLEEVLVSHPNLRIYLENSGFPFLAETISLMYRYPNVYGDLSTGTWIYPRTAIHSYIKELINAGLGKRLMFGSDQMAWPEVIGEAIDTIESADFLTQEQKRDIFYNNAVRFLRLDKKTHYLN
jgi:predicted TIM-barrel fold metal-dependent hydrolase